MISFATVKLTDEIKRQLIMKLTDVSSEIIRIPKNLFFNSIRKIPDENIAVGGKTAKELKEELAMK